MFLAVHFRADTLETFTPRVEQVIDQALRRVFEDEAVPAEEKMVSLFEPHTDIIRCCEQNLLGLTVFSHFLQFGQNRSFKSVDNHTIIAYSVINIPISG